MHKDEFIALGTVAGAGHKAVGQSDELCPPSTLYPVSALGSLSSVALSSARTPGTVTQLAVG